MSKTVYNVHDFGAVGDGRTDDTAAIGRATEAAAQDGPAAVAFPEGTYLIRSLPADAPVRSTA